MDVLWFTNRLHKIFSKDSLAMTINAHASGDGTAALRTCRLCGGDASLRGFNETYISEGVEERYDQLLYDCFGIRVHPSDCLICDLCVRQLRNIHRFRALVNAAFVKQRSEYSSKHSQMGIGEGYIRPQKKTKRSDDRTVSCSKEVVKLQKGKSKTIDVPIKREIRRDRHSSIMNTSVTTKRMNIACTMCNQRYPMIVPFEGWREFICSRCKKKREFRTVGIKSNLKKAASVTRERLALHSKADLRGRSRLCCLQKQSTQLSKTEVQTRAPQQKYQCSLCPKKYVVAQHLAFHMKSVHGERQSIDSTAACKDMSSKEALNRKLCNHTGQPVYQCDVCLRTFKGKRSFQAHYLTHGK